MTTNSFYIKWLKNLSMSDTFKWAFMLLTAILPLSCTSQTNPNEKSVTFEVVLPPEERDSTVYITGNKEEFGSWKADEIPLQKTSDGIWKRTFKLKKGSHIEYKFTRGSWEAEAANPDGSIPQNSTLDVTSDTVITTFIERWFSQNYTGVTNLPINAFDTPIQMYLLTPYWKYHSGDDTLWARSDYDDKSWSIRNTLSTPRGNIPGIWKGIGWFRLHINLTPSQFGKPVHFMIDQFGASEIYLNGKLIRRLGKVGRTAQEETDYLQRDPIIINFENKAEQILAIRYSNHLTMPMMKYGYNPGFGVIVSNPEKFFTNISSTYLKAAISEMTFAGIPFILALLHLLFFVFYRSDKTNLFYGLCLLAFSFSFFLNYQPYFTTSPQTMLQFTKLALLDNPFIVLFGILSIFAAYKERNIFRITFFVAATIFLGIWGYILPTKTPVYAFYVFIILSIIELTRLMVFSKVKREGSFWIAGIGFGILGVILIYDIIIDIKLIKPIMGLTIDAGFGMLALIVTQSINLSLGFARTHKNLEKQLKQVKDLSEKALEQERLTRHQEMERKLLEADNERKTRELEEARRVQLSMLPKTIPSLGHIEIAAFMKTATEVGGDYYDFKTIEEDGSLTAAIGDATGHGTKAGTMVTIAKILFNELTTGNDILKILSKYSDSIKLMNLNQLYMGLTLIYIKGYYMKAASAGMPPFLIYHSMERCAEQVVIKGMPLGCFADFPYQQKEFNLFPGDIVIFMSDGYMEQFNNSKEMLGIESATRILEQNADKEPKEIIDELMKNLEAWQRNSPQQDDITFVVLKFR